MEVPDRVADEPAPEIPAEMICEPGAHMSTQPP